MIPSQKQVIKIVSELQAAYSSSDGTIDLTAVAKAHNAIIRDEDDFEDNQDGNCIVISGRFCISVNSKHSSGRKRFTIAHELAHIILQLPSNHFAVGVGKSRPPEEAVCDFFAAELLLPRTVFAENVNSSPISMANAQKLANQFEVSLTCAVLRIPSVADEHCAAILSDRGNIRFGLVSEGLRDIKTYFNRELPLNKNCGIYKLNYESVSFDGASDADSWFGQFDEKMIFSVYEESRLIIQNGEALTLLTVEVDEANDDDEDNLTPLSGELEFHKRVRRR